MEVEVEAMSIDVSKILTGMGIDLGFESNAAVEQSSMLEIIANGMSIENQVAEYCSLQRILEFDCDNILLHLSSFIARERERKEIVVLETS